MTRAASPRRHGLRSHPPAFPSVDGRTALFTLTGILPGMLLVMLGGAGCGVVGDPIAPEDIGIEAKNRERQHAEALRAAPEGQPTTPREAPEIVLPPLQPVGIQ